MEKENRLGTEKIWKLVISIAIPTMLAQFVSVLYSIIDRIFVGNIAEVGDKSLAGIGVCAPILTFFAAFSILIGIGGGPLMGIAMGEKNTEKAKKILANSVVLLAFFSILVTVIGLSAKVPLLKLCGASENTLPYADTYFTICVIGISFQIFAQGLYQFIIAQGYAKTGMFSIVIGAIMNICLDPLFIFVFKLDIAGAALATIISQAISCLFVTVFLLTKANIKITFKGYNIKTMLNITKLGISPFLIISLDAVMLIAVNMMLKQTGGQDADFLITVNTITQSFMLFITMPLEGISGGTQCILAYNYGACNRKRVLQAQKAICVLCVIYTTIFFITAWVGGTGFIALFTDDAAIAAESFKAIKISTLAIIPLGVQYAIVDGFTGMSQVKLSLFLSLWRKTMYFIVVFVVPFVIAPNAIFLAEPICDVLAVAMTVPCYFIFNNKILAKRESYFESLKTKNSSQNNEFNTIE